MTRFLIFIKHRLPFVWRIIDWLNESLFRLLHGEKLEEEAKRCFREFLLDGYTFRTITARDIGQLKDLLSRQTEGRLKHFRPHGFDRKSLKRIYRNRSFLMLGVFKRESLVGYFFLRCFWNARCFVGRLIDESHERQGIGRIMNCIMYNTAWRTGFRCHTTISKDNALVMRSHANNPNVKILGELPGNYLYIEFLPPDSAQE